MLSEFLRRFREAGVPGAPSAAGAPADPVATLEAELAPVFAALGEAENAADTLEAEGVGQAGRVRTAAAQQARALVDDAHARASGEQAAAAAARLARSDEACSALHTQAVAEAARIDAAVTQRVPPLVSEIVDGVLVAAASAAAS